MILGWKGRMMASDLRGWLTEMDRLGELKHVEGARGNLEIGAVSALKGHVFERHFSHPTNERVVC